VQTLSQLAGAIRTHFRPLTMAQAILVGALETAGHLEERQAVAGTLDMSARELVAELLKQLPPAATEGQRWTVMRMRDLLV
jgi:hypothetical protein